MTEGANGKRTVPVPAVGHATEKTDSLSVDHENENSQSALDEENRKVQAALDEMNRIAFGYKEPPATEKEKVSAVASFVVATVAAVFVPGIPWLITWVAVFAAMAILLHYMRGD